MRKGLALITLCLLSFPTQAHLLKVFASAQGDQIEGFVYFSGGAPTAAQVDISSADGRQLAQLSTDNQGHFIYPTQSPIDHLISADTGDGHLAKWTVSSSELQGTTVPPAYPSKEATQKRETGSMSFEQAIARQIAPLRLQIIQLEERIKLQDMLGGIGYILGLAGLAAWFHSRKKDT